MKNTVTTLQEQKNNGEKITMITCYDYSSARIVEEAGIDTVLVGVGVSSSIGLVVCVL